MKKLFLVYILFLISCSNKDTLSGPITLEFDNRLEDHEGATITYDITYIKLIRQDDRLPFRNTETHHVDAANEASQMITLENVSAGGYAEFEFVVKSIAVHGPVEFQSDTDTVRLTMQRVPVRAQHQPEVHLIFNIDKLSTSVQDAFVVDHVHEN